MIVSPPLAAGMIYCEEVFMFKLVLHSICLLLICGFASNATILTFDVKGVDPNGSSPIPQVYGDNVSVDYSDINIVIGNYGEIDD